LSQFTHLTDRQTDGQTDKHFTHGQDCPAQMQHSNMCIVSLWKQWLLLLLLLQTYAITVDISFMDGKFLNYN